MKNNLIFFRIGKILNLTKKQAFIFYDELPAFLFIWVLSQPLYYIIYSFLSSLSSFILLIFSFTSPLALSYLPSACFFLSPVTLPAASFTFPLTLSLTPSNFSSFLLLIIYSPLLFIYYN